jgi:hypothetical protein
MIGGYKYRHTDDSRITTEKLLEAAFSVQSNLTLYMEDKCLLMIMERSELQAPRDIKR